MNTLVVLAHPDRDSLNHAIADRVLTTLRRNGHDVTFHDLYSENFDPVLPASEMEREGSVDPKVQAYSEELSAADGIVIIHPNWWGNMPALLKGWVDRAFRPGCVYAFEEQEGGIGVPVGMLKATKVVIFNTSNTPKDMEEQYYGDPLETIWKKNVFGVCGAREVHRRMFHGVIMADTVICRSWLAEVEETINRIFPSITVRQAA